MSLDGNAINVIKDLAQSEIKTIGGHEYHVSSRGASLVEIPRLETLKVFSLTQVMNHLAITHKAEEKEGEAIDDGGVDILINVDAPDQVTAMLAEPNANGDYQVISTAKLNSIIKPFDSQRQMSQSDFVLELLTKFQDTPERASLLKLVSNIRAEKIQSSDDDGFSQLVAVKAGVHLNEEVKVPNMFKLKTFKTFPEVDQPEIPYILRLKQRDTELPTFALYECDGGQWQIKTTEDVRVWLQTAVINKQLKNVHIL